MLREEKFDDVKKIEEETEEVLQKKKLWDERWKKRVRPLIVTTMFQFIVITIIPQNWLLTSQLLFFTDFMAFFFPGIDLLAFGASNPEMTRFSYALIFSSAIVNSCIYMLIFIDMYKNDDPEFTKAMSFFCVLYSILAFAANSNIYFSSVDQTMKPLSSYGHNIYTNGTFESVINGIIAFGTGFSIIISLPPYFLFIIVHSLKKRLFLKGESNAKS